MAPSYRVGRRRGTPWVWGSLASVIVASAGVTPLATAPALAQQQQQLSPDDQAAQVLNGARARSTTASTTSPPTASGSSSPNTPITGTPPRRRTGSGCRCCSSPPHDYTAAIDALQKATAAADLPDRPFATYYLGLANRGVGNRSLAEIPSKPAEEKQLRDAARPKFEEAAKQFAAAQEAFEKQHKGVQVPEKGDLPADVEWAARARCDRCEMLLQTGKYKEAADASDAFQSDKVLARSRYRPLGLYHLGYAQFALKDYPAAGRASANWRRSGRTLARTPGSCSPAYTISQTSGRRRRPSTRRCSKGSTQKKAAQEALRDPSKLDPERKARLEAIANGPVPDYVTRATFYAAVLQAEAGQFAEAGDARRRSPSSSRRPRWALEAAAPPGMVPAAAEERPRGEQGPGAAARARAVRRPCRSGGSPRRDLAAADPNNPQAQEQAARDAVEAAAQGRREGRPNGCSRPGRQGAARRHPARAG